jgi:hypothetical protein
MGETQYAYANLNPKPHNAYANLVNIVWFYSNYNVHEWHKCDFCKWFLVLQDLKVMIEAPFPLLIT